jgi:hypothetical protein
VTKFDFGNAIDFEPDVKGESVIKRLADGWMNIHAYTVIGFD